MIPFKPQPAPPLTESLFHIFEPLAPPVPVYSNASSARSSYLILGSSDA